LHRLVISSANLQFYRDEPNILHFLPRIVWYSLHFIIVVEFVCRDLKQKFNPQNNWLLLKCKNGVIFATFNRLNTASSM
jgi:hypothetical protein